MHPTFRNHKPCHQTRSHDFAAILPDPGAELILLKGGVEIGRTPVMSRVTRGFDFLGVDFQPAAPLAASAVSLARKTEKIARLYEQGASPERIGRYENHWQRWLHSVLVQSNQAEAGQAACEPSGEPER